MSEISAPPLSASVRVAEPAWGDAVAIAERTLSAAAAAGVGAGAADVLYTGDAELADLNLRYRGREGPTNVLSFVSNDAAAAGEPRFLGGIALAHGVCEREALERAIPFGDHATHLTLHGLLHLLGHDHEAEADRLAMEGLEIAVLQRLGIANPYEGS